MLVSSPGSTVSPSIPAVDSTRAEPSFFSVAERPVYAVYHPPHRARARAPVVVHCHTLGVEQFTSYLVEVLGARAAAAAGYPVFRYHSRGHGDSAGDLADVTLESMVQDACAAADQAKRLSGATRVLWLGVRFGALVAAEALRRRDDAAALALFEPVHRPADYFRGMLRNLLFSQVVKGERPTNTVNELMQVIETEGCVNVYGYYLHRALVGSSVEADLDRTLESWTGPTFLAQVQPRWTLATSHLALAEALQKRGVRLSLVQINDDLAWHFVANPAWVGAGLVQRYAEWIDAVA